MKTNLLKTALTLIGIICFSLALAQDYMGAPKENERVIGSVTETFTRDEEYHGSAYPLTPTEMYPMLLEKAKKEHPNKSIDIRNLTPTTDFSFRKKYGGGHWVIRTTTGVAKVIEFIFPKSQSNETLVKAVDKALNRVNQGSRLAIDQISVSGSELSRNEINDQLVDLLLENGYKVVAKEYLERLQEEQEKQQGGGFNERTTARTENFSGIGYFLNVRVNEKSIRIQVVNVSTGEYEGNTTVEF